MTGEQDGQAWDEYVSATPDGTVCHLYGWRQVIEHAYGHRTFYLAATTNGVICGVLPLVLIKSRLFGRHLVSMPFMDYGGVVTQEGTGVRNALVAAALKLADAHRATLSLRCATDQGLDLPLWLEKLTMVLDLGKSEEALWKRLPSERRNRIRKGQKNGLDISFHGADALEAFYSIFAVNMRDLGSPVHSRGFFRHMFTHLSQYLRIILVHHQGRPIGAACCLFYKEVITIPGWISALRPFFSSLSESGAPLGTDALWHCQWVPPARPRTLFERYRHPRSQAPVACQTCTALLVLFPSSAPDGR